MTTADQALEMAQEANEAESPPDPRPTFIEMTHPAVHVDDSVAPATATEEAFDEVWAPRGWVKVEQVEQPVAPTPAPRQSKTTEEG